MLKTVLSSTIRLKNCSLNINRVLVLYEYYYVGFGNLV